MGRPRLYGALASWWPVMSVPEDYAEEAEVFARVLTATAEREVREVLELGSGGGNNASHLRRHFRMTLVDLSPHMLEVSRALNPDCEHVEGDMRSVRLGRDFDAVFVHDAIMYMTSAEDLHSAMQTAHAHLRPGGVALFVPDESAERFKPTTGHGGHDRGGRSMRYLMWVHDLEPDGCSYRVSFAFLMREGDGPVEIAYDEHRFGVFPTHTWLSLLEEVGFVAGVIRHAYGEPGAEERRELFVGLRPPLS